MICSIISSIAAESFADLSGKSADEHRKAKRLTAEHAVLGTPYGEAAEKKVAEKAHKKGRAKEARPF